MVQLARTADFQLWIVKLFFPLRNPSHGARHGKDRREHRRRESHSLKNDAGIEIDVREQLFVREIRIGERLFLKLHRDLKDRVILNTEQFQHFVSGFFHHRRAGVKVFVNAVAETHQTVAVVFVFGAFDKFRNAINRANFLEHFKTGLVGTAVGRTPKTGNTRRDTGKRVRTGRRGEAHCRCRCVLFVICVQCENTVHRAGEDRVHDVIFGGVGKTHPQEIGRIIKVVARIHKRLTDGVFIGPCRNRWHFRDQTDGRNFALVFVRNVGGIVIKRRHRANHTDHNGHRVRIAAEATEKVGHLFVQHRVVCHEAFEPFKFSRGGELSVQQQVTHFEVVGFFCQLINGIATVQQFTFVAVNKSYRAVTCRSRREARIIGENASLTIKLADIDHIRARGRCVDRQLIRLTINGQCRGFLVSHSVPFLGARARVRRLRCFAPPRLPAKGNQSVSTCQSA